MELREKEQAIIEWAKTPIAERKQSKRGLAQKLGVGIQFIDDIVNSLPDSTVDYDSEKWLQERAPKMDEALTFACEKGNAAALLTYYKLTKRLVDQSEMKVKLEISAEDYAREHTENRRWLKEHSFVEETGVGQVRSIPALLPENIREGEGQT